MRSTDAGKTAHQPENLTSKQKALVDSRVEAEVEAVQRAALPEVGGLVPAHDHTLTAHMDFILKDQFKELGVWQSVCFGLLQAQIKTAKQSREPQVLGLLFERMIHGNWVLLGFVG